MDGERCRFDTGHCFDALDDLIEERQSGRSIQPPCRIHANRHRAARVEAGIDIEQRREAAQQESAGHREHDDEGDLGGEGQALHVDGTRIGGDPCVRPQPVNEVSTAQVQQRDTAEHDRDRRAQHGRERERRPPDLQFTHARDRQPRGAPDDVHDG